MNPADEDGYMPTQAEVTHDSSENYASLSDEAELDIDNSPLVARLNMIHHLPSPYGNLIARVRLGGKEAYVIREAESGGIFAYDCADTRMVIPICKRREDLPSDEKLKRLIVLRRSHYEA